MEYFLAASKKGWQYALEHIDETAQLIHEKYQPEDARYLTNHRGHLMYVRPEETHITPELVKSTTMSGSREDLILQIRELRDIGYDQVTIQLVHGVEDAIEEWADVFQAI